MLFPKVFALYYTIVFHRLLFLHSVQSVNKINEGLAGEILVYFWHFFSRPDVYNGCI